MKILSGHTSPETAYVVEDYPYGFRLRCRIRYWLEYKPRKGFRLVSQTTNPKYKPIPGTGNPNVPHDVWNKPKASTYCRFGGCMYLDENDHVKWSGLSEYCDGAEAQKWLDTYGAGVPVIEFKVAGKVITSVDLLRKWVAAKVAYDANRTNTDPLSVGLPEARKAFAETE